MGSLNIPPNGLIYVDTNTVIYSIEGNPTYSTLLSDLWKIQKLGNSSIVSSELTLMETLVGPLRFGNVGLTATYEQLWQLPETRLLPITREILREAARLRAMITSLRTPDAVHAATALIHGCSLFVTNDAALKQIPGLPVVVLDDALN